MGQSTLKTLHKIQIDPEWLPSAVCTYVVYHCYILRFTGFWYKWGHKDILSLQCFQKTFLFCRQHSIFMLINLSKYYVPGTYFNHFGRDLKSSRESLRHAGNFHAKSTYYIVIYMYQHFGYVTLFLLIFLIVFYLCTEIVEMLKIHSSQPILK